MPEQKYPYHDRERNAGGSSAKGSSVAGKLAGFLKHLNRLESRFKNLLALLALTVLLSLAVNLAYKPQQSALRKLKQESVSLDNKLAQIKGKIPDLAAQERLLQERKKSLVSLREELGRWEAQLPRQGSLPQLLGELVEKSSGSSVQFSSIKPVAAKNSEEYPRLDIEMKFKTNYPGLVNYLHYLENLSPFISAGTVTAQERKEGAGANLDVTIMLSALLGSEQDSNAAQPPAEKKIIKPISVQRDPYASALKPARVKKEKSEYVLSGIINNGRQSTAVISDNVYKIGDRIGNGEVKEIYPDRVILRQNGEDIILPLERESP